ncbi:ATP-dependent endonuclease [Betaproteobacteria bacterium GR16-43]|nr:ATP-dependent endonuclease [Betaproteobacteria bacterium GR16-43]
MRVAQISIRNFRGIRDGTLLLPNHAVLVGDNNIGKSTVLEAIDLVLGPERLARRPSIDEHDFHAGDYLDLEGKPVPIEIEVVVVGLGEDQIVYFKDHLEWWKESTQKLLDSPPAEATDELDVVAALRVRFRGLYEAEDDDFSAETYFASPKKDDGSLDPFRTRDKRICGFLYLRTLRTGSRALSLERGSLLDVILRLEEKQLRMWEEILEQLRVLPVAENPEIGITEVLANVQTAVRDFVPMEWASNPHMRVSDLTRETLRKTLTVFIATGAKRLNGADYSAPFHHQGTGTINTLVLALLSIIADLKSNVIFAMEEPETAIPPHAQKRIIKSVCGKSAQALFTSHSPYVLEEFPPEQVVVLTRHDGTLQGFPACLPPAVKPKKYKEEFRKRFCEVVLARHVLVAEGRTEYDAFPEAARRLHELDPGGFRSLEAMGVAVIDAETDSQIAPLCAHFRKLGKTICAVYDKQSPTQKAEIEAVADHSFEGPGHGFENTLLDGTAESALRRFAKRLIDSDEWPNHLVSQKPTPAVDLVALKASLKQYLKWAKGKGGAADLLSDCSQAEMPQYVVDVLAKLNETFDSNQAKLAQAPLSQSTSQPAVAPKSEVEPTPSEQSSLMAAVKASATKVVSADVTSQAPKGSDTSK